MALAPEKGRQEAEQGCSGGHGHGVTPSYHRPGQTLQVGYPTPPGTRLQSARK
jgi:hypothetical protein